MRIKIFILEDNDERVAAFDRLLPQLYQGCQITHSKFADESKKILKDKDFDLIFLDHDLGGRVYVNSSEPDTGYQVAKFIAENGIKYQQLIIHSMNPAGAQNMLNVLGEWSNSVHIPFPTLLTYLENPRD